MRRRWIVLVSLMLLLAVPLLASAQSNFYVVQHGDTLGRIAARFGTNVHAIASANSIFNINHIYAGQVLVIPTAPVVVPPPPIAPPPVVAPPGTTLYTVQRGDILSNIARAFNTTIAALSATNGIANPSLIYPGQVLVIPPHAPPTVVTYVVVRGDELRFIAARFGTTWQAIATLNGLAHPNLIYPGQVLRIQ